MFDHLLNELIHFWLANPKVSFDKTLEYALATRMIDIPSVAFVEYIKKEHAAFCARSTIPKDWIDVLPEDDTPIGANPFMVV